MHECAWLGAAGKVHMYTDYSTCSACVHALAISREATSAIGTMW